MTGLDLDNRNLVGSLSAALGNLTELTFLDLSENRLTGAIPADLGDLADL